MFDSLLDEKRFGEYLLILHRLGCGEMSLLSASEAHYFSNLSYKDELDLQLQWYSGECGRLFRTVAGDGLKIVDFGRWNRGAGPDFLGVKFEVGGVAIVGDVELDLTPESWEGHGHAVNPNFNKVQLHISAQSSEKTFFHRREDQTSVPYAIVLEEHPTFKKASDLGEVDVEKFDLGEARERLWLLNSDQIDELLKRAAEYRAFLKYKRMAQKAGALSEKRLLFEAFADVLGYSKNQQTMKALGHRVGVDTQNLQHAESVFLGAAGLLSPEIHRQAPEDTKQYLEGLWEEWWSVRQNYELDEFRQRRWNQHGMRPANHFHRRIATLGLMSRDLDSLLKCFKEASPRALSMQLAGIHHEFWGCHYSLKSQKLPREQKLWGASRVQAFLINYWYPAKVDCEDAKAWFLKQKLSFTSDKVVSHARRLFGQGVEVKYAWQEQGLLQLGADFFPKS